MPRLTKAQKATFATILDEYNHCCAACGSILDTERDHVMPRSAGGDLEAPENLQPLCGHCNNLKNGLVGLPKFPPRQPEHDSRLVLINRHFVRQFFTEVRELQAACQ